MSSPLALLQNQLSKEKIDGLFVTDAHDITYLTGYSNFSIEEREGFLVITKNAQFIITDGRYSEAIRKIVPHFTLIERTSRKTLHAILEELKEKLTIQTLGINEDNVTISEHKILAKIFPRTQHFSIDALRMIKTDSEIAVIKKACQIGDAAYKNVLKKLKAGMTEKEVAFLIEMAIKHAGADLSFPTIAAFGPNASVPHHLTSEITLKRGDFVLLDFGVRYENYCSDMTRTIVFGNASAEQQRMLQAVLAAQTAAIDYITTTLAIKKPVRTKVADAAAREYLMSENFPSIPHSLGHGIGVEVHEAPRLSLTSNETLSEGMVFSIEPGIYIPEFGGVRIEDLFVIQKNKLVTLTKARANIFSTG